MTIIEIEPPDSHRFKLQRPPQCLKRHSRGAGNYRRRRKLVQHGVHRNTPGLYFDVRKQCRRNKPLMARAPISTTSAATRTFGNSVNPHPFASTRLSFRGDSDSTELELQVPHADLCVDVGSSVSSDIGMITKFPANYRTYSTMIPSVQELKSGTRKCGPIIHLPANIINEYPVGMNVTSYATTVAPINKHQSSSSSEDSANLLVFDKGTERPFQGGSNCIHKTFEENSLHQEISARTYDIIDAVAYASKKPISRYNSEYMCSVLRIETWSTGEIVLFYSARGSSKCGRLPEPSDSCLLDSNEKEHYCSWHNGLLHVCDDASGYELREGVLGFSSILKEPHKVEDLMPTKLKGLPASVSFVYGGRAQPNKNVWWSPASLRVYSRLTTWVQRESLIEENVSSLSGPSEGHDTTILNEIRRKPKIWPKQDYSYEAPDKNLEKEINLINRAVQLRQRNAISRPHTASVDSRSPRLVRRVSKRRLKNKKLENIQKSSIRAQAVVQASERPATSHTIEQTSWRPNGVGMYKRPRTSHNISRGSRALFNLEIPKPPVPSRKKQKPSSQRRKVYGSQFRLDAVSGKTPKKYEDGLATSMSWHPPVVLGRSDNYHDSMHRLSTENSRTVSEIEAAGDLFDSEETTGDLKSIGASSSIWRRAARGFAEAVLTRAIVAIRSTCANIDPQFGSGNGMQDASPANNKAKSNMKSGEREEDNTSQKTTDNMQIVFELDEWIKQEVEDEGRRQKFIDAYAEDKEKQLRLKQLYAVDRERALSQLSKALPHVIGELFDDAPLLI